MKTQKITEEEIQDMKISSLPTRPTAPSSLGGRGYTSREMRGAFDKLSLYIIKRFNMLLEDVCAVGENSMAGAIKTEISEGHSLANMFSDIPSGRFSEYLSVGEVSLAYKLAELNDRITRLEEGKE